MNPLWAFLEVCHASNVSFSIKRRGETIIITCHSQRNKRCCFFLLACAIDDAISIWVGVVCGWWGHHHFSEMRGNGFLLNFQSFSWKIPLCIEWCYYSCFYKALKGSGEHEKILWVGLVMVGYDFDLVITRSGPHWPKCCSLPTLTSPHRKCAS